jgi:hypothetical protein
LSREATSQSETGLEPGADGADTLAMTNASKPILKKRRAPRRRFEEQVGLLHRGSYALARAFEIGERGILISSPTPLRENDRLVLTFHVPGLFQTVARAVVRYTLGEPGREDIKYGCEFENINFVARRMIRIYVASKLVIEEEGKFQKSLPSSPAGPRAKGPTP